MLLQMGIELFFGGDRFLERLPRFEFRGVQLGDGHSDLFSWVVADARFPMGNGERTEAGELDRVALAQCLIDQFLKRVNEVFALAGRDAHPGGEEFGECEL
jgi:hypothetical protein